MPKNVQTTKQLCSFHILVSLHSKSFKLCFSSMWTENFQRYKLGLEKAENQAMATHSSTLAWRIPWTEGPGRLQSMGLLRVRHDWVTSLSLPTFMHWRRKWQPTPVFLPGESQGRGSLMAAVYGVAQSRTWLKRLSSSSSKRGTRDQIANIHWTTKKVREFQKNICFCFIDYTKAFMWITKNCGKFLNRWEYQATLSVSWETCMQVKNQ